MCVLGVNTTYFLQMYKDTADVFGVVYYSEL